MGQSHTPHSLHRLGGAKLKAGEGLSRERCAGPAAAGPAFIHGERAASGRPDYNDSVSNTPGALRLTK
jgi:hypothetical protein